MAQKKKRRGRKVDNLVDEGSVGVKLRDNRKAKQSRLDEIAAASGNYRSGKKKAKKKTSKK